MRGVDEQGSIYRNEMKEGEIYKKEEVGIGR
jgi:hypothetical protein